MDRDTRHVRNRRVLPPLDPKLFLLSVSPPVGTGLGGHRRCLLWYVKCPYKTGCSVPPGPTTEVCPGQVVRRHSGDSQRTGILPSVLFVPGSDTLDTGGLPVGPGLRSIGECNSREGRESTSSSVGPDRSRYGSRVGFQDRTPDFPSPVLDWSSTGGPVRPLSDLPGPESRH